MNVHYLDSHFKQMFIFFMSDMEKVIIAILCKIVNAWKTSINISVIRSINTEFQRIINFSKL